MAGKQALLVLCVLAGAVPWLAAGGAAAAEGEMAGFGIVVSAEGDVLAPFHVAASCDSLESPALGRLHVMHADSVLDLAHLMTDTPPASFAHFADSSAVKPGDSLTVLVPAPDAPAGTGFSTRKATVKALFGDDRIASFITVIDTERHATADALLLDDAGGLVGFVLHSLGDGVLFGMDFRVWAGPTPEGAAPRIAVGEAMLRHFLDHHHVAYERSAAGAPGTSERVRAAVTPIACGP